MLGSGYITNDKNTTRVYNSFAQMFEDTRFLINSDHEFIEHFLPEYKKHTIEYDAGKVFYRGRINEQNEFKDEDLRSPQKGKASPGRLNPKGIPYLYVSEEVETVVAEVRPWIGADVTIAECTAIRGLKVVDFHINDDLNRPNSYRRVISQQFSRPVRPNTKELDYLPTQ